MSQLRCNIFLLITTTDHHKRSSSIQLNQPITIEHLVADRDHATSNGFINSSRLAILTKLKRSDSISSINSYNSYFPSPAIIGQFHFRACLDCSYLVDKRLQLIKSNIPISTEEQSAGQAKVAHFLTTYQEMHRCIIEVRKLLPSYSAKVDSLSTYGKSIQQYNQARRMREEIMRNGEKIEHLSRSLQILTGVMDPEAEINLNLVKAIRSMSCKFLKDNFLTLPKLPDQASFDETLLSDKCHVVPIQPLPLKVPDDNEKTTPAHQSQSLKIDQSHLSKHGTSTKELANTKNERVIELVSSPVSPALSKNIGLEEKDVLREQIEIITGYLETALKTDDLDQVYTLETNLKELKDILDAS
ncbi:uncharacterized protein LOC135923681 isoform X1 [Gordionus sp. m RMFG-2023]|uniref:uncharacterized protein LOC135923681 isoform X1 n=1 Tax=Gordionus sp. m RMFG-2023 TaxID=3053472 RepID=UPI0031FDAFB4